MAALVNIAVEQAKWRRRQLREAARELLQKRGATETTVVAQLMARKFAADDIVRAVRAAKVWLRQRRRAP